ncbi:hypothetical protein QEO76_gp49 [Arthrobacter phage Cole]|uniref:Uncharacterized protein n=1 Tax=Arthrobacter phage Cole TaxID=2944951 RepID=A0A9E7E5L3_9CAUD|nr:hypothetical protein QEO76_gp49 [Arthrobacter phage Cole]URC18088.1 hypothetical protein SEA_COLE_51 [Arthrobacter phage Cole]
MSGLLSPDCRDGNHTKCDGVAWDLELDGPSACECDCQCNGKASFTVYPHTKDEGLECIVDGEGTMRTLAEADGLAWNKGLTDAELAAEYWRAEADLATEAVGVYVEEDRDGSCTWSLGGMNVSLRLEALHRFGNLPHHDELP